MSRTEPSLGDRSDVREGSALAMRRSRGAMSGFLLVLLGIWGAIIPFVGPYFGYTFGVTVPGFSPTTGYGWTSCPASPCSSVV
ncbi:MAG: hypothetical protein M3Y73_08900 [Actinomycetota bacterium]|nr:hypothetical protein [Actinomycetota bacterium]